MNLKMIIIRKHYWLIIIISFVTSIVAGFTFYKLLINKPFGLIFNLSQYLLIGGLVLGFLVLALLSFKSSKLWLRIFGIMPSLLSVILFLLFLIISIDFRILFFAGIPPHPVKAEWKQDIHFLAEKMQKIYPNLDSKISEQIFRKTLLDIDSRLPELSEMEIKMEMFRLVALLNDGHSIPVLFNPVFGLHDLPIKIYKFEEGWYIIDASNGYDNLIGTKIIKIGSSSIEEVFPKFQSYLSAENDYGCLERFTRYGLMTEWLKSIGIINNIGKVNLTLEKSNGEQFVQKIDAIKCFYKFLWTYFIPVENSTNQAFMNRRNDWYWFKMLKNSKSIYFQITDIENQSGKETIAKFSKRLNEFASNNDFERFVIDLRNNIGGNGIELINLMNVIRDNEKINQQGKLFVLIGRQTFSAGVLFAYKLKLQTNAILIGEPTSQGPIFGSNIQEIELPNSKLEFYIASVSTSKFQSAWDFPVPTAVFPDISVSYSYNDFEQGNDMALNKALNYDAPQKKDKIISDDILNRYAGRYILDSMHVVDILCKDSTFHACIDDFIPGNLFRFQSQLYAKSKIDFETNIPNVSISFSSDSVAIISWEGQEKVLKRAPKSYVLDFELLAQNKIDEAIKRIISNKTYYCQIAMLEDKLNLIAYEYLNQRNIQDAIKIFDLVVQLFPNSANAFDSLGEAYMNAGNKELAIKNYEKSLELNPQNTNASERLKKLKEN